MENEKRCDPEDACATHGRCWTHSEWDPPGPGLATLPAVPVPEPRHVIKNREDAWLCVDSLGQLWTSHLVSALAFTSEDDARRYIARSFSPERIEAEGLASQDVTGWPTAPIRAWGSR